MKNDAAGSDAELEFTGDSHTLRVTPVRWNDQTLCVSAPGEILSKNVMCEKKKCLFTPTSTFLFLPVFSVADFPAGNVSVTVYSNGVPLSTAQLQYYSSMEELTYLLSRVADPVEFMCQVRQNH